MTALEHFTETLKRAQEVAAAAEHERTSNRPKFYLGTSDRTRRRHRQTAKNLKKKGYILIKEAFARQLESHGVDNDVEVLEADHSDSMQEEGRIIVLDEEIIQEGPAVEETHISDDPNQDVSITKNITNQDSDIQKRIEELLKELHEGNKPMDNSQVTYIDKDLNQFNYLNFPALRCAQAKPTVISKDKKLDVVFRAQITGM
ncbi:hypothetical protein C0993_001302, partial [Termitomyces sp. T159_Od127]